MTLQTIKKIRYKLIKLNWAFRVAGENSTTEPQGLLIYTSESKLNKTVRKVNAHYFGFWKTGCCKIVYFVWLVLEATPSDLFKEKIRDGPLKILR